MEGELADAEDLALLPERLVHLAVRVLEDPQPRAASRRDGRRWSRRRPARRRGGPASRRLIAATSSPSTRTEARLTRWTRALNPRRQALAVEPVVAALGAQVRGQRQVVPRPRGLAGLGQRPAQAEVGVVVDRMGLDHRLELADGAAVVMGAPVDAAEGLADGGLLGRLAGCLLERPLGVLEIALLEQLDPAPIERVEGILGLRHGPSVGRRSRCLTASQAIAAGAAPAEVAAGAAVEAVAADAAEQPVAAPPSAEPVAAAAPDQGVASVRDP